MSGQVQGRSRVRAVAEQGHGRSSVGAEKELGRIRRVARLE